MTKDRKLGIRIALSFYREKMPWVYEEGILLLNKIEGSKTPATLKRHLHEFEELLMVSTRNPIMEEFLMEDKEDFFLLMELPKVILHSLERIAFENPRRLG
jgi:hypothetical protein